ncbi:MAG TPA: PilZ domain-containing protein [Pyrinomonadaceae bacterium]|nr:PilZ domain-containing protein [Pyrinomonadaceae bacterium]
MNERRQAPRVKVDLLARWEGAMERQEANVTNLSTNGCFVLSGGKVEPKELVRLEIFLPNQDPVYLWAEVVDVAPEIGFAVRFTMSDEDDQQRLAAYLNEVLKHQPQ